MYYPYTYVLSKLYPPVINEYNLCALYFYNFYFVNPIFYVIYFLRSQLNGNYDKWLSIFFIFFFLDIFCITYLKTYLFLAEILLGGYYWGFNCIPISNVLLLKVEAFILIPEISQVFWQDYIKEVGNDEKLYVLELWSTYIFYLKD